MKRVEKQLRALQDHLMKLSARANKARGQARRRLKRLERQTRVKVARTVQALEPKVRQAVAEAAIITRGVRAGAGQGSPPNPRSRDAGRRGHASSIGLPPHRRRPEVLAIRVPGRVRCSSWRSSPATSRSGIIPPAGDGATVEYTFGPSDLCLKLCPRPPVTHPKSPLRQPTTRRKTPRQVIDLPGGFVCRKS
jgi:hypothetical protein